MYMKPGYESDRCSLIVYTYIQNITSHYVISFIFRKPEKENKENREHKSIFSLWRRLENKEISFYVPCILK